MSEHGNTLEKWILGEASGEEVIGIVIGSFGSEYQGDPDGSIPKDRQNTLLTWEETVPFLRYDFYSGYGGEQCHSIYAWTKNKVIFIQCYDGSTAIASVPRNPIAENPCMFGGG